MIRHGAGARRAVMSFFASRDHRVMARLNGWVPPRWVRFWMLCASRGGDGWLWCAIAVLLLLVEGSAAVRAVAAAALSAAVGTALFMVLKHTFRRTRPCAIAEHCWADLLPPDQFSFPSGHSITAFAVAISLGLSYPALLPVLLFCAASVAASRVMLGMHFLTDVVVGSGIGALLAYAAAAILN